MIKLNTTILDFDMVLDNLNIDGVLELIETLNDIKLELMEINRLNTLASELNIQDIILIEQQLWFVNLNIETVDRVLSTYLIGDIGFLMESGNQLLVCKR